VSTPSRTVLVDSNVLLDVLTEDPQWYAWSSAELASAADENRLALNPIVYAEVSIGFERIEDLDEALPSETFVRLPLPWSAAFLAGKCFLSYRRAGGTRHSPLPDFYIGAHAAVERMALLTRDAARYRFFQRLGASLPARRLLRDWKHPNARSERLS
jgi:predicted nucleic acid-binding protein